MTTTTTKSNVGFSILELLLAMTIMLVLMGIVSSLLAGALSIRARESQKTDALSAAQAALNSLSRDIANAGFGIYSGSNSRLASNGVVAADSNANQIHVRSNIENVGPVGGTTVLSTNQPGEDITYFFDAVTKSIVRYDPNDTPQTAGLVNKISSVTFAYYDYSGASSTGTLVTTPTNNTGRVQITVTVQLDPVNGQPNPSSVTFTSDVTLRNSSYMLNQY